MKTMPHFFQPARPALPGRPSGLHARSRRLCSLGLLALLLLFLAASRPAQAGGFKSHGFSLPDGAVKVDDDRYRLPQSWEDALRFYRSVYPPAKFPRHTLKSQSQVRAIHLENRSGGDWDGANLYESAKGEVRVYVLATEASAEPAKGPAGRSPKKP